MRMQDLAPPVSPDLVSVETVPASEKPRHALLPGDFLLGRAHGPKHRLIRFGQGLRVRSALKHYAGYTHAALVVSAEGDLIEAVGAGLQRSTLLEYVERDEPYQVVRIEAEDLDRRQIVAFAENEFNRKARYGWLANVSTAVWAFTGSQVLFKMRGSFTCSGLVASALQKTWVNFDVDPAWVTPAQLAIYFDAPPPPPGPERRRRSFRAWLRRSTPQQG